MHWMMRVRNGIIMYIVVREPRLICENIARTARLASSKVLGYVGDQRK